MFLRSAGFPILREIAAAATVMWAAGLGGAPAIAEEVIIPAPVALPCVEPPAAMPAFVTLSAELAMDGVLAAAETAAPAEFGSGDFEWFAREEGALSVQYGLRRGALTPSYDGDGFTLESPILGWMNVRGDGFEPTGCASPEDPFLIRSSIAARIGWRDDWHVDAQTTPQALIFETRCKPKPPGVNFTPLLSARIEERCTQPLAEAVVVALQEMDDVARAVRAAWSSLTREKEFLNPAFRLALQPSAIRVAPIRCADGRIFAEIAFEMSPRIVAAGESPSTAPLPPLPSPRVRLADGMLRVPIDLEVSWADVEKAVLAHVAGKTYADRRGSFRVDGARVFASGTKAILALEVTGALSGTLYLEGTPVFEAEDHVLAFSQVTPTAETLAVLGEKGLRELGGGLQLALRFPVHDLLGRQVEEVGRAVNGGWGAGVAMRGGMARWESQTPFVSAEGLGVRAVLLGEAAVTVE